MRLDSAAWVRVTWLATTFMIFGIGFGMIWWPASQSIDQVRSHSRNLYKEANQNDAIVLRASDLHAAQRRIQDDLMLLGGKRSPGAVTAAALRLLNDEGKRLNVDVRSLSPSLALAQGQLTHDALNGTDVAIGVRGPFRNVINFVADLPRHDVLIEVHDAQINSSDATRESPALDVTINATIYRFTPSEAKSVRSI